MLFQWTDTVPSLHRIIPNCAEIGTIQYHLQLCGARLNRSATRAAFPSVDSPQYNSHSVAIDRTSEHRSKLDDQENIPQTSDESRTDCRLPAKVQLNRKAFQEKAFHSRLAVRDGHSGRSKYRLVRHRTRREDTRSRLRAGGEHLWTRSRWPNPAAKEVRG
nr:uncharacterized protein LOC115258274 [Aedes albopictus]